MGRRCERERSPEVRRGGSCPCLCWRANWRNVSVQYRLYHLITPPPLVSEGRKDTGEREGKMVRKGEMVRKGKMARIREILWRPDASE